jgi:hypothetical protein
MRTILEEEICEKVGFCGCGNVSGALKLLYNVLLQLSKRNDYSDQRDKSWDDSVLEIKRLLRYVDDCSFDNEMYWTYFYFLDQMELTEHGGSVNGCWLTPKGLDVLNILKEYFKNE